jgi:hypothetical protein
MVHLEEMGVEGLTPGPVGLCGVCCTPRSVPDLSEAQEHAAVDVLAAACGVDPGALRRELCVKPAADLAAWLDPARRPLYLQADGNVKFNHYKTAGTVTTKAHVDNGFLPLRSTFFGGRNGPVPPSRFPDDAQPTCGANILAARQQAHAGQGSKDLDRKSTTGFCCHHAVPVKDSFTFSDSPEQYANYDNPLPALMRDLPELEGLAMDIGCK